jgi:hypothetical protein
MFARRWQSWNIFVQALQRLNAPIAGFVRACPALRQWVNLM